MNGMWGWRAVVITTCLSVFPSIAAAQPNLHVKRIVRNWPTIEVYFQAACSGQPVYVSDASHLAVRENGAPVAFTLFCPDPGSRCPFSVALTLDRSGSMSGAGIEGAKAAGRMFIGALDGAQDQAAIVSFNELVTVNQAMTTDTSRLRAAFDSLVAGGFTAVWDATYKSVEAVAKDGTNPCRAVVVVSDGDDSQSWFTPAEVIALAQRNRIRVFTIGLGSFASSVSLQQMAEKTGGRYYNSPTASELQLIFSEIAVIIRQGFQECLITYQASCADGSTRATEVTLVDVCQAADSDVVTYTAPFDTTTFTRHRVSAGSDLMRAGTSRTLPLALVDPFPQMTLPSSSFDIDADSTRIRIDSVTTAGTMLDGVAVAMERRSGGVRVRLLQPSEVSGSGTLVTVHVTAAGYQGTDTLRSLIRVSNWSFASGCIAMRYLDGVLRIAPNPVLTCDLTVPVITMDSARQQYSPMPFTVTATVRSDGTVASDTLRARLRPGGLLTFAAPDTPYDAVKLIAPGSIAPGGSGQATWTLVHPVSIYPQSPVIEIEVLRQGEIISTCSAVVSLPGLAPLRPVISASGPLSFCDGDSVVLDAGAGHASQRWNTGATTRTITVQTSGAWYARVTDTLGRVSTSDTVVTFVRPHPSVPPINRTGDTLSVSPGLYAYQWYRNGTLIAGATNPYHVAVQTGVYTITITDTAGCSSISAPFDVVVLGVQRPAAASAFAITIHPNPTREDIDVTIAGSPRSLLTLSVVDASGRVLHTVAGVSPNAGPVRIPLAGVGPGTYFVIARAGAATRVERFVRLR